MARPSKEEKARLEARRVAKEKLRADNAAQEKRTTDRVQGIIDTALTRPRDPLPDREELILRLEEARQVALSTFPPQVSAAVAAVMAEAKLMGLWVDKSMVAVGTPQDFLTGNAKEQEEAVYERIRERLGSRATDRFKAFVEDMRRDHTGGEYNGDAIDGNGRLIEDGREDE
jgi:hypothetical protein